MTRHWSEVLADEVGWELQCAGLLLSAYPRADSLVRVSTNKASMSQSAQGELALNKTTSEGISGKKQKAQGKKHTARLLL